MELERLICEDLISPNTGRLEYRAEQKSAARVVGLCLGLNVFARPVFHCCGFDGQQLPMLHNEAFCISVCLRWVMLFLLDKG